MDATRTSFSLPTAAAQHVAIHIGEADPHALELTEPTRAEQQPLLPLHAAPQPPSVTALAESWDDSSLGSLWLHPDLREPNLLAEIGMRLRGRDLLSFMVAVPNARQAFARHEAMRNALPPYESIVRLSSELRTLGRRLSVLEIGGEHRYTVSDERRTTAIISGLASVGLGVAAHFGADFPIIYYGSVALASLCGAIPVGVAADAARGSLAYDARSRQSNATRERTWARLDLDGFERVKAVVPATPADASDASDAEQTPQAPALP